MAIDWDKIKKGLVTYVRIYVEVDLSAGLPEQISLSWNSKSWTLGLDYENTTFRCRSCQQTRHLQGTCPKEQCPTKRKPKTRKKKWNSPDSDEEPEIEDKEEEMVQDAGKKNSEEIAKEDRREDNCGEEQMQSKTYTQQESGLSEHIDLATSGIKRHHESSDSDKDPPSEVVVHNINEDRQLAIVALSKVGWIQVKPKKGKKGRMET